MNEYATEVLEAQIGRLENAKHIKPDSKLLEKLVSQLQQAISLLKNTEVVVSGVVEISGHDVKICNDKEIFYIDDVEFWEKYEGQSISITRGEV